MERSLEAIKALPKLILLSCLPGLDAEREYRIGGGGGGGGGEICVFLKGPPGLWGGYNCVCGGGTLG